MNIRFKGVANTSDELVTVYVNNTVFLLSLLRQSSLWWRFPIAFYCIFLSLHFYFSSSLFTLFFSFSIQIQLALMKLKLNQHTFRIFQSQQGRLIQDIIQSLTSFQSIFSQDLISIKNLLFSSKECCNNSAIDKILQCLP